MPCSCCGQAGHNIRTCASGPTPGGVSAMRARISASNSSSSYSSPATQSPSVSRHYSSVGSAEIPSVSHHYTSGGSPNVSQNYSSGGYGSFAPSYESSPVPYVNRPDDSTARFNSIRDDIIKNTDTKFSGVKRLVSDIEYNFTKQLSKIQHEIENHRHTLEAYKRQGSDQLNKVLGKIEADAANNLDNYDKFMHELKVVQRSTLKHIDAKFEIMRESFAAVEQKTKENEKQIKKNSHDILEIKQMLGYLLEKLEKKEAKPKKSDIKEEADEVCEEGVTDDSDEEGLDERESLDKQIDQLMQAAEGCRSKQNQPKVMSGLALKNVINKK